jgi:hypothetical protein
LLQEEDFVDISMPCGEGYKKKPNTNNEAPLSKLTEKCPQALSFSVLCRCGMGIGIAEWHQCERTKDASGERLSYSLLL